MITVARRVIIYLKSWYSPVKYLMMTLFARNVVKTSPNGSSLLHQFPLDQCHQIQTIPDLPVVPPPGSHERNVATVVVA
jgi:hypothetical protein